MPLLQRQGHEVTDAGPDSPGSVDYPDLALQVAGAVGEGRCQAVALPTVASVGAVGTVG